MKDLMKTAKQRFKIQDSIKNRLLLYTSIVMLIMVAAVIFINANYVDFLKEYNSLNSQYNEMQKFYESVKVANEHISSYCYSYNNEDYKKYDLYIKNAVNNINKLKQTAKDENSIWKYKVLSYMLDTYTEKVDEVVLNISNKEYEKVSPQYYKIMNVAELINTTINEYFSIIINDMNISGRELYNKWLVLRYVTAGLLVFMLLFCIICSILFLRSINRPLGLLLKKVQKILKGDYDVEDIQGGGSEIKTLVDAVNRMSSSLGFYVKEMQNKSNLEKKLLEQENENLKMHNLIRETELKALQNQINPHFLFNTLSIISKTAYLEGADSTFELMEATTELLRYNLDKSSKMSDLESEIESVKDYLIIQKKRFGKRISWKLNVDKNIGNIKIPALIIQPIIENAVVHGVGDMLNGASIAVNIRGSNKEISVTIEDNGKGMESEKIEYILSSEGEDKQECSSIGLMNVKKRLEMFFGIKGLLNIESSLGCGTVVTLNLPIR